MRGGRFFQGRIVERLPLRQIAVLDWVKEGTRAEKRGGRVLQEGANHSTRKSPTPEQTMAQTWKKELAAVGSGGNKLG
jgi:hypothetical protein